MSAGKALRKAQFLSITPLRPPPVQHHVLEQVAGGSRHNQSSSASRAPGILTPISAETAPLPRTRMPVTRAC